MQNQPAPNPLLTRVVQGLLLGTVFAVPVALWAYNQAAPVAVVEESPRIAAVNKTTRKAAPKRKPMRAVKEAETIPASQMHLRIDDGRRRQTAAADN